MEIDTISYLILSDVIEGRLQSSCVVCQEIRDVILETLELAQCGGASSPEQTLVFAADSLLLLRATRAMIQ
jgi:hypothetical protein